MLNKIKDFDIITIFRHVYADMDAIGSQFGLRYYIESMFPDKKVYCLGEDCIVASRLGLKMDQVDDDIVSNSLAIVVDTSNSARVDDQRYKLAKYSLRVDHHVQVETFCSEEWIDEHASATCELLALWLYQNHVDLDEKASMMLYLGLTADNIRFTTSSVRSDTFVAAKYLFDQGVDVNKIDRMNFAITMNDYRYETLVRTKAVQVNHFLYSIMECEDYASCNLDFIGAKDKVYVLSGIESIEIWALFTRMSDGIHYSASLRSSNISIREVASQYNGGGHACASGIKNLTYDQVLEIVDILKKMA